MFALVLLVFGLAALAFGTSSFFQMKRMALAPFRRTGEVALRVDGPGVASASGLVATEGKISAPNAIRAPCSGHTCLYYEITLDREWERPAEGGASGAKETGTTRVTTTRGGTIFQLDDGSGPVHVDTRDGAQAELAETHLERFPIGQMVPGEIQFGQMRVQTPENLGSERTLSFTATERVLLAQGELYACGKVTNGMLSKPAWADLVLSQSGRDAQLVQARRRAAASLLVGALLTAGSIPAFLLRP